VVSHGISWFGVGAGNFVPWLMRQQLSGRSIGLPADQYQPVHNIYLLVFKELGLVGLLLFLVWLGMAFVRRYTHDHLVYAGLFSMLLLIGLFDHFLWTIQAGSLLFWLIAGLFTSNVKHEHQN
jgi:O-antigen ligase